MIRAGRFSESPYQLTVAGEGSQKWRILGVLFKFLNRGDGRRSGWGPPRVRTSLPRPWQLAGAGAGARAASEIIWRMLISITAFRVRDLWLWVSGKRFPIAQTA